MDNHIQKELITEKLKTYIREKGYTKISFCKKYEIKDSFLEEVLNPPPDIVNEAYIDKVKVILSALKISFEELLNVHEMSISKTTENKGKQYQILLDIIDLCAIYY